MIALYHGQFLCTIQKTKISDQIIGGLSSRLTIESTD